MSCFLVPVSDAFNWQKQREREQLHSAVSICYQCTYNTKYKMQKVAIFRACAKRLDPSESSRTYTCKRDWTPATLSGSVGPVLRSWFCMISVRLTCLYFWQTESFVSCKCFMLLALGLDIFHIMWRNVFAISHSFCDFVHYFSQVVSQLGQCCENDMRLCIVWPV